MEGAQHRDWISDLVGYQLRFQGCIPASVATLGVHSDPTGNIENWNDLHRPCPPAGSP
jgi:hypothetical protein